MTRIFSFVFSLIIFCAALSAQNLTMHDRNVAIIISDSLRSERSPDGYPYVQLDYEYPVFNVNNPDLNGAWLNEFIRLNMKDIGRYDTMFMEMEQMNLEMRQSGEMFGGEFWDYFYSATGYFNNDSYLTLMFSEGGYMGGAHGNYTSVTCHLNPQTGEQYTLESFFGEEGLAQLLEIGEKLFREHEGLDPEVPLSESGYWFADDQFHLGENYTFDMNGMNIAYNHYEIAPYSAGVITFTIPADQIKGLFLESSPFRY